MGVEWVWGLLQPGFVMTTLTTDLTTTLTFDLSAQKRYCQLHACLGKQKFLRSLFSINLKHVHPQKMKMDIVIKKKFGAA